MTENPIVEFRNVSFAIDGAKILEDINLEIFRGETLVLLGESGCGKTTTLKLINRLIEPTERRSFGRRKIDNGLGRDKTSPAYRLRFAGSAAFSAFYG